MVPLISRKYGQCLRHLGSGLRTLLPAYCCHGEIYTGAIDNKSTIRLIEKGSDGHSFISGLIDADKNFFIHDPISIVIGSIVRIARIILNLIADDITVCRAGAIKSAGESESQSAPGVCYSYGPGNAPSEISSNAMHGATISLENYRKKVSFFRRASNTHGCQHDGNADYRHDRQIDDHFQESKTPFATQLRRFGPLFKSKCPTPNVIAS